MISDSMLDVLKWFNKKLQDLISLLDAGINADHPSVIIDADAMFSEDMFGYAAQSRAARSSGID